jgi:hypothetical protein
MIEVAKRRAIVERLHGLARAWEGLDPGPVWRPKHNVLSAEAVKVVQQAIAQGLLSDLRKYFSFGARGFCDHGGRPLHAYPTVIWSGIVKAVGFMGPEEEKSDQKWFTALRKFAERVDKYGDWNNWPADVRDEQEAEAESSEWGPPSNHLCEELSRHHASICRTLAEMVAEAVTAKPAGGVYGGGTDTNVVRFQTSEEYTKFVQAANRQHLVVDEPETKGRGPAKVDAKPKGTGKGKRDSDETAERWVRLKACIDRVKSEGSVISERELAERAGIPWGGTWKRLKKKPQIAEHIAKVCGPVERGEKSRRRKVRHIEGADTDGK